MSYPLNSSTPRRQAGSHPATSGISIRPVCSADPDDFTLIKIHTAKCSVCDKRNRTDQMRRCQACTWQICKPCQEERRQQGRTLAHGSLMTGPPSRTARRRPLAQLGTPVPVNTDTEAALAKAKQEQTEDSASLAQVGGQSNTHPSKTNRQHMEQLGGPESPLGPGVGTKRRFALKDRSPTDAEHQPKRAYLESEDMATLKLGAAKRDTSEQKQDEVSKTSFDSQEVSRIMQPPQQRPHDAMPGLDLAGVSPRSHLHRNEPAPTSQPARIPVGHGIGVDFVPPAFRGQPGPFPIPVARPRVSGETFVERMQQQVRVNLHTKYGWPLSVLGGSVETGEPASATQESAVQPVFQESSVKYHASQKPASQEPTPKKQAFQMPGVQESAAQGSAVPESWDNIREICRIELYKFPNLYQYSEHQIRAITTAMREVGSKLSEDYIAKMPIGFKAIVSRGLDLKLEHLTDDQKEEIAGAIHTAAQRLLTSFEVL